MLALESAAGRIFKEKVQNFETELLEPLLNAMLEVSRRNMDIGDVIRVMDDELGVNIFATVTKEDITAKGKLRPRGAQHFFSQQQLIQNMTGLLNSPAGQLIAPHISSLQLAKLAEDLFGLERYQLIEENIAIIEQMDRERMAQTMMEDAASQDAAAMAVDNQTMSGI